MGPILGVWGEWSLFELVAYNDPRRRLIGEEQFNFATLCVGILRVCLGWWFGILNVASSSCSKLRHQLQVVELCWKATSYNIHRATWYCCSTMFLTPDLVQPQLAGCVAINLYNRSIQIQPLNTWLFSQCFLDILFVALSKTGWTGCVVMFRSARPCPGSSILELCRKPCFDRQVKCVFGSINSHFFQ